MTSSNKKKRERAKDFQKIKLKVGKAKPKAANFTDTGFKAKSIVMGHQSITEESPNPTKQFTHQLSLATTSKSDKQRKESLAYLTTQLTATPPHNPLGTSALLLKIIPLITDLHAPVRRQLLACLQALPPDDVRRYAEKTIMYVRAGITHVSSHVSNDALLVLSWLLDVAPEATVSCPGGWIKTLSAFCAIMGWSAIGNAGWTNGRSSMRAKDNLSYAKQISTLAHFIHVGLGDSDNDRPIVSKTGYLDGLYSVPRDPEAFSYLNLFGKRADEDGEMYQDREARQRVFRWRFWEVFMEGNERSMKEGGAPGRAAVELGRALEEGMKGFDMSRGSEWLELDALW